MSRKSLSLYPASPSNVPQNLTHANASYKRHAWLAMAGLMIFMTFYIGLMLCFAVLSYNGIQDLLEGKDGWGGIVLTVISVMMTIFMVKSLFSVRKAGNPRGVEVTQQDEPELYEFLHTLADEIGAPKPHRVFVTSEVNAAVFYDLTLLNLIFPSKKNLIIGLGLVNVLNLGELKAVLAHEFGHFAQGSMVVGRWVYIAQQIISHMVATRDWLDSIVKWVSRFDLRIAWLGWVLTIILWSIRSLMDTLFSIVIMAERALSREMEFNADLVAVSATGSDALIDALHKLQSADHAWQTALNVADIQGSKGRVLDDLFRAQSASIKEMQRVLNDKDYGSVPVKPLDVAAKDYRVFSKQSARPPQMWATHPANSDREENAKRVYVPAEIDQREAWAIFADPKDIRKQLSLQFYNPDVVDELEEISALEAVIQRFSRAIYSPEYLGTYLRRSPVRRFSSVSEMLDLGEVASSAEKSLQKLYPDSLTIDLEAARDLDIERDTLEALQSGDLKPSGGVIRHRGEELKRADIPDAIKGIVDERKVVADKLKAHDASCRRAHLQLADEVGQGWHEYLVSLIDLLHYSEHLLSIVENEQALLINTWNVITADGQIGYFEKRRMVNVCNQVCETMNGASDTLSHVKFVESAMDLTGIDNWQEQRPVFDFNKATKSNWANWVKESSETMSNMSGFLVMVRDHLLDTLVQTEAGLRENKNDKSTLGSAPEAGAVPKDYPVLLPGKEHALQRKLDFWNRFQLAQGFVPTILRLIVSVGIVGGTVLSGLLNS